MYNQDELNAIRDKCDNVFRDVINKFNRYYDDTNTHNLTGISDRPSEILEAFYPEVWFVLFKDWLYAQKQKDGYTDKYFMPKDDPDYIYNMYDVDDCIADYRRANYTREDMEDYEC